MGTISGFLFFFFNCSTKTLIRGNHRYYNLSHSECSKYPQTSKKHIKCCYTQQIYNISITLDEFLPSSILLFKPLKVFHHFYIYVTSWLYRNQNPDQKEEKTQVFVFSFIRADNGPLLPFQRWWNDIIKPIHFSASLSHNKQKKYGQSMTSAAPHAGGTFTNLLAVEGDRNKNRESKVIKKACPYQCFFSLSVSEEQALGQSMNWCKLMQFQRLHWAMNQLLLVEHLENSELCRCKPHTSTLNNMGICLIA